jgi:hypothetical protein
VPTGVAVVVVVVLEVLVVDVLVVVVVVGEIMWRLSAKMMMNAAKIASDLNARLTD